MYAVAHETLPGTVANRTVDLGLEIAFLDAPCHAVEEEGCARHLLAAKVGVRDEAGIPETVFLSLAVLQGFAHDQEVFLELLVILILWREEVHAAHEGGIDPAVATTPVAVLAIGGSVGGHIVLVAPPQAFFLVEESASERVTAPEVHLHGVVGIFALTRHLVGLHIDGHGHLDSVDPGPPAVE